MKLSIFSIFCLLFTFPILGQTEEWKTLENDEYSIQYPASWELNTRKGLMADFFILSKMASAKDKFRENINLIVEDLQGAKVDLDQCVEVSVAQVKAMITKSKVVSSTRVKTDDSEFHKMIYTGKQGKSNLKFEQYYFIQNGKLYVLTFTALKSDFDDYQLTAEKIMDSFVIK